MSEWMNGCSASEILAFWGALVGKRKEGVSSKCTQLSPSLDAGVVKFDFNDHASFGFYCDF